MLPSGWTIYLRYRRRSTLLFTLSLILIITLYLITRDKVHLKSSDISVPTASFKLKPLRAAEADSNKDGKTSIPRIIHQTWKSEDSLPETFRLWMESWLSHNADWSYWFWTDKDMREFMRVVYPQFLSLYDSYPTQGYRADAFRYFVLYKYGGLYADIDMECLIPLSPLIDQHSCLISQEPLEHAHFLSNHDPPLVSNALMTCQASHQFFAQVIGSLKSYAGLMAWTDILHATGPRMLSDVYRRYQHSSWFSRTVDRLDLADPNVFQPTVDASMVDHMRRKCLTVDVRGYEAERRQKTLCDRLIGHDFGRAINPLAYTNHHWTHTWAGRAADPWALSDIRTRFNVSELRHSMHVRDTSQYFHPNDDIK